MLGVTGRRRSPRPLPASLYSRLQAVWEEVHALREQLAQAQAVMQRQEDQLSEALGTAQAAQHMAQQVWHRSDLAT